MGKVTWRSIRQNPVRLLMTVLAIALGTAFMSGTLTLRTMMSDTYGAMAQNTYDSDLFLRGASLSEDTTATVPLSLVDDVAALPGVERALPRIEGPVVLVGADGAAVRVRSDSAQRPGDMSTATPSRALVVWPDDPTFTLASGRLPAGASEIALDETTAQNAGLTVGDSTQIVLDGQIHHVQVTGLVTARATSGETTVVLDEGTGTTLLAAGGTTDLVAVDAAPGADVSALAASITALVPTTVEVLTGEALRAEHPVMDASVEIVPTMVTLFAVIALLVGAFMIANTFAALVRQRLRETALLRALGASGPQVFVSVVGQAAALGVVGSLVGAGAGFAVVAGLRAVLGTMGLELSGAVPFAPGTVLLCLAIGTLVSVASAAVPARRAAKVPPIAAMRDAGEPADLPAGRRGTVGSALVLAGAAATLWSLRDGAGAAGFLGVGAFALVVGALVAAPAVVPVLAKVLGWPAVRALPPLGALARGNVSRRPRRTATTASALMIVMVLVGLVSVVASSAQESVHGMYDDDVRADFVLQSSQGPVPLGAVVAVEAAAHAERVDPLRYAELDVDGLALSVGAAPEGTYSHSLLLLAAEGSVDGLAADEAVVLQSTAELQGWRLGDKVRILNQTSAEPREVTARIGAIADTASIGLHVMISDELYDAVVPAADQMVNTVFVTAADGDVEVLRGELEAAAGPYLVVSVLDHGQYVDAVVGQIARVVTILYALLGLSLVIAVLGVVNTLALSVMERTREIGVMRAVGLGRLQLATTVVVESVLISVMGALAGLAIGVGVGAALPSLLASMGLAARVVPWGQIVLVLVLTVSVAVLAGLVPGVRASRLPVLRAITEE